MSGPLGWQRAIDDQHMYHINPDAFDEWYSRLPESKNVEDRREHKEAKGK
jgi:hypothetical protein